MWLLLSLYRQTCPLYQLQLFWIQAVQTEKNKTIYIINLQFQYLKRLKSAAVHQKTRV